MANNVIMKSGLRKSYDAISQKDINTLYFCTDTGEIFKGDVNMSQTNTVYTLDDVVTSDAAFDGTTIKGVSVNKDTLIDDPTGEIENALVTYISKTKKFKCGDVFKFNVSIFVHKKESDPETRFRTVTYISDGTGLTNVSSDFDAEHVYFKDDIIITHAIGNITLTEGQGTIPSAGKNLKQVFESIFTQEKDPSVTQSSAAFNVSRQYKEIGQDAVPQYDTTWKPGSYQYGPDTGVTVKQYSIIGKLSGKEVSDSPKTTSAASFKSIRVVEGDCFKVSGTVSLNAQTADPLSNLKNPVQSLKIKAKNVALTETTVITGYKPNFCGYTTSDNVLTTIDSSTVTSAFVRGLQENQGQTTTPLTTYSIPTAWRQFFYAVPAGRKANLKASDKKTGLPLTIVPLRGITVNHINGVTSTYDVFYANNAIDYGAATIVLEWS